MESAVFADINMARLGKRLQRARRRARLTQHQVADLAAINRGNYNAIEGGQRDGFTVRTLYRICLALNVSADSLLGLKEGVDA